MRMKTLADGRFFGGNRGWRRTHVFVKPVIPVVLSVEDVFGFVWSLPITTLVSGMESIQQVSQNAGTVELGSDRGKCLAINNIC